MSNVEKGVSFPIYATDQFSGAFDRLKGLVTETQSGVGALNRMVAALGVGLSVGGFAALIKGAIDSMDHLNDLSKTTRISAADLSGLGFAARQSGSDLDSIASAVTKLATNMGKNSEKFAALGVSAKDPIEAFKKLADVTNALEDPQQRAAVLSEALGKSWQQAAPLLAEGSAKIGEMVEKGKALSGINGAMVAQADELKDKWAELAGNGGMLNATVGASLPLLNKLTDDLLRLKNEMGGGSGGSNALTEILRVVAILGGNVIFVLKAMGVEIGGIAAQLAALAHGDFARFAEIGKQMKVDAAANRTAFDAWESSIMAVGAAAKSTASALDSMDQVQRRMASEAAAAARAFLEADQRKRDAAEAAKKAAAEAERLRELDNKGWVAYVEEQIAEYERGLKEEERLGDEFWKQRKHMQELDDKGWVAFIEQQTKEYEDGLREQADKLPAHIEVMEKEWTSMWNNVGEAAGNFFSDLVQHGRTAFDNLRQWVKQLLADMIALFAKRWILNLAAGGSLLGSAGQALAGGTGSDSMAGGLINYAGSAYNAYLGSYLGGTAVGAAAGEFAGNALGLSAYAGPAAPGSAAAAGQAIQPYMATVGWVAAIVAGMLADNAYFSQGWRAENMDNRTALLSGNAPTMVGDRLLRGLGFTDRWASVISGSSLADRFWGYGPTHADAYGVMGSITGTGITGQNWQDYSQRGGVFRDDRRWKDTSDLSTGQSGFLQGLFDVAGGSSSLFGRLLGVDPGKALAGYSHDFNFQLSNNGQPLDQAALNKLFGDFLGTVLQEQTAQLFTAAGDTKLADYVKNLQGDAATVTQSIADIATAMQGLAQMNLKGLNIDSLMDWRQKGETLIQTFQRVATEWSQFQNSFMSEDEKLKAAHDSVLAVFDSLGVAMPQTNDQFIDLVKSLDLSTQAGRDMFDTLMAVAPAFQAVTSASEATLAAFNDLMRQVRPGFGGALDSTNLQSMVTDFMSKNPWTGGHDWSWVLQQLRTITPEDFAGYLAKDPTMGKLIVSILQLDHSMATNSASTDNNTTAIVSTSPVSAPTGWDLILQSRTNIGNFLDSLFTGPQSPLSPQEQYARAQSQYESDLALAQKGDTGALGRITGDAGDYLTRAQSMFGSSSDYIAIFKSVTDALAKLSGTSDYNTRMEGLQKDAVTAAQDSALTLHDVRDLLFKIWQQGQSQPAAALKFVRAR